MSLESEDRQYVDIRTTERVTALETEFASIKSEVALIHNEQKAGFQRIDAAISEMSASMSRQMNDFREKQAQSGKVSWPLIVSIVFGSIAALGTVGAGALLYISVSTQPIRSATDHNRDWADRHYVELKEDVDEVRREYILAVKELRERIDSEKLRLESEFEDHEALEGHPAMVAQFNSLIVRLEEVEEKAIASLNDRRTHEAAIASLRAEFSALMQQHKEHENLLADVSNHKSMRRQVEINTAEIYRLRGMENPDIPPVEQ